MIDIVVKSLTQHIGDIIKNYSPVKVKYSNELDSIEEFRSSSVIKANDSSDISEDGISQSLLLFNRLALDINENKHRMDRRKVYFDAVEYKKHYQLKQFLPATIPVEFKFVSQDYYNIELFELFYLMKLVGNSRLIISLEFEDSLETYPTYYDIEFSRDNSFNSFNYIEYGSLWEYSFNAKIYGPLLSPESVYYPKLLNIYQNAFAVYLLGDFDMRPEQYAFSIETDNIQNEQGEIVGNKTALKHDYGLVESRLEYGN